MNTGSALTAYIQVNKLRWVNDDLNKKAFEAQQRGLRLAEKLGFGTLEEAEAALATQAAEGQSQLCQYPSDELASHVQALQSELINHVNLGKTTLGALNDALEELSAWKEENAALRAELERVSAERNSDDAANPSDAIEVDYLREELATLQKQYTDLQEAKARSDEKHAEDFGRWRRFKEWLVEEELRQKEKHERAAKRRKLSPRGEDDEKENEGSLSPDRLSAGELEKKYGNIKRRLQEIGPRLGSDTPTRVRTPGECSPSTIRSCLSPDNVAPKRSKRKPSVLSSRNLNSRSIPLPPPTAIASSSKLAETPARPQNLKRDSPSSVVIPDDDVHPSSETEFESQRTSAPVASFVARIDSSQRWRTSSRPGSTSLRYPRRSLRSGLVLPYTTKTRPRLSWSRKVRRSPLLATAGGSLIHTSSSELLVPVPDSPRPIYPNIRHDSEDASHCAAGRTTVHTGLRSAPSAGPQGEGEGEIVL